MNGRPASLLGKAWRFATVGVLNSVIDFAAFAGLVALSLQPLLANLLAWGVAVVFSFTVNSRWTFMRPETFGVGQSFLRFALSGAAISLGTSTAAVYLLPAVTGLLPAKLIGIAVGAVLNFFAARWSIERRLL